VAGDLKDLAMGNFDPAKFFKLDAKLLGSIELSKLISGVFDEAQFPKALSQQIPPTGAPTSIITTLAWSPKVREKGVGPLEPIENRRITLTVTAHIEQKLDGSDPTYNVEGKLRDFQINFADALIIQFDELTFRSRKNEKLDVSAQVVDPRGVQFAGALSFLNKLQQYIDPKGFIDPPSLDVSPSGVTVGYSLGLPPLAVGVFALQNVSISAGLFLPFTSAPARLRFAFSERHHPFSVTLGFIAGGGFLGLGFGLDGIEIIEGALEIGGNIAINLGVASGGVSIMIGIYVRVIRETNSSDITGYVRMNGALEVLGLLAISVEFYLGLSYLDKKVRGEATLTVTVEIAFFSKSVRLHVERSFGGSSADPTFAGMMPLSDWRAYAEAFT
jgi:hypothetical protein